MAYDTSKLLNLGQGQKIALRVMEEARKLINALNASDIKFGDGTIADALDSIEEKLENGTGCGCEVATDEEVDEMLDEIFGAVDGTRVYSLDALKEALEDDSIEKVILATDIVGENGSAITINSGAEKTLDLAGYNVSVDGEAEDTVRAIYVTGGSTLNLYDTAGNSLVDAGENSDFNMGIWAAGDSVINVYGGNYVSGTVLDDATGSSTVYVQDGIINIFGGHFENTAMGEHKDCDVLNIRNNSGAHIYCYGGTFVGQDPADGDDKDTTTGATFLAEGYVSVESEEDGKTVYTVIKEED